MWQVVNSSPYRAASSWIRDQRGEDVWLVAVKATFEVSARGELSFAPKQEPVLLESDFVLAKVATDVIVHGNAAARDAEIGLRVGALAKSIRSTSTAALGPVARDAMPRKLYGGTYDREWIEQRRPLLPIDYDVRFNQCAPEDQQVHGFLRGGEPVLVTNMSASGLFMFVVPKVTLAFESVVGERIARHRGHLYSLILEPNAGRFIMIWQTSLACHDDVYRLWGTRIFVKERI